MVTDNRRCSCFMLSSLCTYKQGVKQGVKQGRTRLAGTVKRAVRVHSLTNIHFTIHIHTFASTITLFIFTATFTSSYLLPQPHCTFAR